jgi:hypothetical protein
VLFTENHRNSEQIAVLLIVELTITSFKVEFHGLYPSKLLLGSACCFYRTICPHFAAASDWLIDQEVFI